MTKVVKISRVKKGTPIVQTPEEEKRMNDEMAKIRQESLWMQQQSWERAKYYYVNCLVRC